MSISITVPDSKPVQSATPTFKGSCACGRITYSSTEKPSDITLCHCITCRKISGGPYQAFAHVKNTSITLYDNKEHLRYEDGFPKDDIGGIEYLRLSKMGERAFCKTCHATLMMWYRHQDYATAGGIGLAMGCIDEGSFVGDGEMEEALRPEKHIFVSQKAWWSDHVGGKDGSGSGSGIPAHERFDGDFEEDMKAAEGKEG
jgi:hypothetical protein